MSRSSIDYGALAAQAIVTQTDTRTPEDWRAFERAGRYLMDAVYRFAIRLAHDPHHYTVRNVGWEDEAFLAAVEYIRQHGYAFRPGRNTFAQLNVNEHFYWPMWDDMWRGADPASDATCLINRKRIALPSPYDAISRRYDEKFCTSEARLEDVELSKVLLRHASTLAGAQVLDVGCGTGRGFRVLDPESYMGVDPSGAMLSELRHRHPEAGVVQTPLAWFVPSWRQPRFSLVTALYGSASYLTNGELERLPQLATPGGVVAAMFYAEGYKPPTYKYADPDLAPSPRPWSPGLFPADETREIGPYVLAIHNVPVERDEDA